jgi:hypothetical protein
MSDSIPPVLYQAAAFGRTTSINFSTTVAAHQPCMSLAYHWESPRGETANRLFEALAEWNQELTAIWPSRALPPQSPPEAGASDPNARPGAL